MAERRATRIRDAVLVLGMAALAACGGGEETSRPATVQQTTPLGPSLVVTLEGDGAFANGVSEIVARVVVRGEDGNLVADGTPVSFSTDLGTFVESDDTVYDAQTANGEATARLTSTTDGSGTLTVSAVGLTRTVSFTFAAPPTGTTGGGSSGGGSGGGSSGGGSSGGGSTSTTPFSGVILLSAAPSRVAMGMENTVTLSGWVISAGGYEPGAAVEVTFAIADWSATKGSVQQGTETDTDGSFSALYRAGTAPGNVTIYACVKDTTICAQVTVSVVDRSPASITLTPARSSLDADGSSQTTISVVVLDSSSQAVPDGTEVQVRIVSGSGSIDQTVLTTSDGNASFVYTAGTVAGLVQIEADADGVTQTLTLNLIDRSPQSISLSIEPTSVEQGQSAWVTATVLDGNLNPVLVGTTVTFSTDSPTGRVSPPSVETDENGRASAQFYAGSSTGVYRIWAVAGSAVTSAVIVVTQPGVGSIAFVDANPQVIGVRGSAEAGNSSIPEISEVRFLVLTSSGTPVPDGTVVNFSLEAPQGTRLLATSAQTVEGYVSAFIRSGTVAGTARVIASLTYGGQPFVAPSQTITIQSGQPADRHLDLVVRSEDVLVSGISTSGIEQQLTFYAGDRYDNPAPDGIRVWFTAEGGDVVPPSATLTDGRTSTVLVTKNPRPLVVDNSAAAKVDFGGAIGTNHSWAPVYIRPLNRRVRVVAMVQGEEWFSDDNANGVYDPGENFVDVGEPFVDYDSDGQYDAVVTDYSDPANPLTMTEAYFDTVTTGDGYSPGNGVYDASTTIWTSTEVWWTDNTVFVNWVAGAYVDLDDDGLFDPGSDIVLAPFSGTVTWGTVAYCTGNTAVTSSNWNTLYTVVDNGPVIYYWIGDSEGVYPYNGGQITFSAPSSLQLLPDRLETRVGSVYPTGLRFAQALTFGDTATFGRNRFIKVVLPDKLEFYVTGVCLGP